MSRMQVNQKANTHRAILDLVEANWPLEADAVGGDILGALVTGRLDFLASSGGARLGVDLSLDTIKLAVEFISIAVHLASISLDVSERRKKAAAHLSDPKYRNLDEKRKRDVFVRLNLS